MTSAASASGGGGGGGGTDEIAFRPVRLEVTMAVVVIPP